MIGEIEGVHPGQMFADRRALHDAGVHRGLQQGIGAKGESIVLSGGFIDDRNYGDIIIYTGEGGRDVATGRQVADQQMIRKKLKSELCSQSDSCHGKAIIPAEIPIESNSTSYSPYRPPVSPSQSRSFPLPMAMATP